MYFNVCVHCYLFDAIQCFYTAISIVINLLWMNEWMNEPSINSDLVTNPDSALMASMACVKKPVKPHTRLYEYTARLLFWEYNPAAEWLGSTTQCNHEATWQLLYCASALTEVRRRYSVTAALKHENSVKWANKGAFTLGMVSASRHTSSWMVHHRNLIMSCTWIFDTLTARFGGTARLLQS